MTNLCGELILEQVIAATNEIIYLILYRRYATQYVVNEAPITSR